MEDTVREIRYNEHITYPLTSPQRSIWITEQRFPGTGIGIVAATLKVWGEDIDFETLRRAVNLELERNGGYRLRVVEIDGEPRQYVAPYRPQDVDFIDFTIPGSGSVFEWDKKLSQSPFPLIDHDLFYFAVYRSGPSEGGVYIKTHHLLSDAWTLSMFGNHIIQLYGCLKNGTPVKPEVPPQYTDYIRSELTYLESDRFRADEAYWTEKFVNLPEPTTLKSQKAAGSDTRAHRKTYVLPPKLCRKIREHCEEYKTSPFALFLASLAIYVNRVTGKEDMTIGTPVLNRSNHREKNMVGMFISTIPLRISLQDGEMDFRSFYSGITRDWMTSLRHQKYPYDLLLTRIREQHRNADSLYDILISYQNAKILHNPEDLLEHEGRWHFCGHQLSSLSIHINDREGSGELIVDYDYRDRLFYAKEVDFIHDHIIRILWHALDNPARAIRRVEMISEKEKHKLLHDFNDTDAAYPRQRTLHGLFREQAAARPDHTALVCGDRELSYRELDRWSDRIAADLQARGAGPDRIVALLLRRSLSMVAAILGVLKSGAAYLPIDPDYPPERIRYLLQDSAAPLLVRSSAVPLLLPFGGQELILPDAPGPEDLTEIEPPTSSARPENLAYIIYTSGSTGLPKGVMIEHRNVVRLLHNDRFPFRFDETDVWSLFHSYCFDFSVWEMYGSLLYGGQLVVVPRDAARDTPAFYRILRDRGVTVLNQTPAAFYQLIREDLRHDPALNPLRYVIFGGEALKPMLLKPFHERYPDTRLVNMYGITETTVHVTVKELSAEDLDSSASNIGRPIPTLRTYVMDAHQMLLPIGIPGELCVSGDGVARGYLNNPELTDEKFISHPLLPGERLYRSGDLVRLFSQGDMEYLGRLDKQVKIRGHRIELGEIEAALLRQPGVREAVVTARENQSGTRDLVAYYVADRDPGTDLLRDGLKQCLPSYMIPSLCLALEQLPLTGNGKVDRARLPEPVWQRDTEESYVAPDTPAERRMTVVWAETLDIAPEKLGVEDDFFTLGGDSLSAIRVIARLESGLTVADLYEHPTIRSLCRVMEQQTPRTRGLLRRLSGPDGTPGRVLVCFPYGGGSAYSYRTLAECIHRRDPDTVIYAVALPGHDVGSKESPEPPEDLAIRLSGEIRAVAEAPLYLYAHCVGTALAYETVRLLEECGCAVAGLTAGAILPPRYTGRAGRPLDPWKHVPDAMVLSVLRRLGLPELDADPEVRTYILRAFRGDVAGHYRIFHAARARRAAPLTTPVRIVTGDTDPLTRSVRRPADRWRELAQSRRHTAIPEAGHYFLHTHPDRLAALLVPDRSVRGEAPAAAPVRPSVRRSPTRQSPAESAAQGGN